MVPSCLRVWQRAAQRRGRSPDSPRPSAGHAGGPAVLWPSQVSSRPKRYPGCYPKCIFVGIAGRDYGLSACFRWCRVRELNPRPTVYKFVHS